MVRLRDFWSDKVQKTVKGAARMKMDAPQHDQERQQFIEVLESFKATRISDRLAVLDEFLSVEQHLTLLELQEIIRQKLPHLQDREFLKETMDLFCMFGFAQKRVFESRDPLYEHRHLGMHHDHFICIRCGEINEFANDELESLQLSIARQHRFHPLQHKMEIYGLCSDCMRQRDENLPLVFAARGERVRIVQISGGREMRARLADMGLTEGVCVEVISNIPSGPSVVAFKGSRLAIAAGMAQQIIVSHSCAHAEEQP